MPARTLPPAPAARNAARPKVSAGLKSFAVACTGGWSGSPLEAARILPAMKIAADFANFAPSILADGLRVKGTDSADGLPTATPR